MRLYHMHIDPRFGVQRVIEASGIPTTALSMIPDLTRAVGVPPLAGIGYPMGRPLGRPHDVSGQRAVLRSVLELLAWASGPDTYVELPYVWPPIVDLLIGKPWLTVNLYAGRVPNDQTAV